MSVLIINGSPRKSGNVAIVCQAVSEGVDGKNVEWVNAYDLSYQNCVGCMKCRPDKECVLPADDAHLIGRKIAEASALVIGTPTYWGNMSSPLKGLLDRNVPVFEYIDIGSGFPKPRQKGKQAIIVTACSAAWPFHILGSQGSGALRAVSTVLKAAGYDIVGKIIVPDTVKKKAVPDKVIKKAHRLGARL